MTTVTTIGLDIAKSSFTLHGCGPGGATVLRKTMKRAQVAALFGELTPCRVGLEACGSAHHWAREIAKFGHAVRLIPPSRVKRFVIRRMDNPAGARQGAVQT